MSQVGVASRGVIRMAPPLTIPESDLHQGIDLLEQSIVAALKG